MNPLLERIWFWVLWLLAQGTRHLKVPGAERLVRLLLDPGRPGRGHFQTILRYEKTLRIQVDTTSFLEWSAFFFGYEPELGHLIHRHLSLGGVAMDVGANVGFFTLVMAKAVGDSGRVIAVEPEPRAFQRLKGNLQMNSLTNVLALPFALGEEEDQGLLNVWPGDPNQGKATLCPVALQDQTTHLKVEVKTLDALVQKEHLARLDLIKVDTEGWDWFVLKGGERSIRRFHPAVIFEYAVGSWRDAGALLSQTRDWLTRLGYELFLIRPRDLLPLSDWIPTRLVPFKEGPDPSTSCNVLAIPRSLQGKGR